MQEEALDIAWRASSCYRASILFYIFAPLIVVAAGGCATVPAEEETTEGPEATGNGRVTYSSENAQLGDTIRQAGAAGGNVVLMGGLEEEQVGEVNFNEAPPQTVVSQLSEQAELAVEVTPHYSFLFPAEYEALANVSLEGQLHSTYEGVETQIAFGAGTPLFVCLAWMSQATGVTIVADNEVAEAQSGELALGTAPLSTALEALLKSARVANFYVDSTEEYIFLYSGAQGHETDMLLNRPALDQQQEAMLEQRVTVYMPEPPSRPNELRMLPGATPLAEVLPSLSRQLGVRIVAEPGLEELPVNPAVFQDVRVGTAMDLLIRQWLRPEYGYHAAHDRLVIRRRTPGEL